MVHQAIATCIQEPYLYRVLQRVKIIYENLGNITFRPWVHMDCTSFVAFEPTEYLRTYRKTLSLNAKSTLHVAEDCTYPSLNQAIRELRPSIYSTYCR